MARLAGKEEMIGHGCGSLSWKRAPAGVRGAQSFGLISASGSDFRNGSPSGLRRIEKWLNAIGMCRAKKIGNIYREPQIHLDPGGPGC